jgi:hypothetical protein
MLADMFGCDVDYVATAAAANEHRRRAQEIAMVKARTFLLYFTELSVKKNW